MLGTKQNPKLIRVHIFLLSNYPPQRPLRVGALPCSRFYILHGAQHWVRVKQELGNDLAEDTVAGTTHLEEFSGMLEKLSATPRVLLRSPPSQSWGGLLVCLLTNVRSRDPNHAQATQWQDLH